MGFNFSVHAPLLKMMWQASKRDFVAAIPWFPLYSIAEVLLAIGSAMLFQLLFTTTQIIRVQSLLPGNFKNLVNTSLSFDRTQLIFFIPIFIATVAFIKFIGRFMSTYLIERAGHRMVCKMREKMLESFLSSSGNKIDEINIDEVANQAIQDSALLQSALSKGTISAVRDSFVLVCIILSLIFISWKIFLIGIIVVIPMVFLLKKTSQKLNYYTREGQKKSILISTRFLQTFNGILNVFAIRSQKREHEDFTEFNEDNYKLMKKSVFVKTFFSPAMEFIGISLLAGLFFWRMNTKVNFEAVNYSAMIILVLFSFRYIKSIASTLTLFSDVQVVFNRVSQFFKDYQTSQSNVYHDFLPSYSKEALIAKNVSYSVYPEQKILENCNVKIEKGKKIAFVGESGSGKTTFLRILAGLIIPTDGKISICENYLMAFQTPYVFRGSIKDNIVYNHFNQLNDNKIESKCYELVRALHLAFTESGSQIFLNKKLKFLGEGLSGGEKARVALSRILFASPSLILLDEPTANLDARSSRYFWQAIDKWKKQDSDHTVIAVSHLIKEVIDFDYCYVFSGGKIIQEGHPRDILNYV